MELKVLEQCVSIVKIDHVQRQLYKTGYPKIHGWIYNLHNGVLKDLAVNMSEYLMDIRKIYDLETQVIKNVVNIKFHRFERNA